MSRRMKKTVASLLAAMAVIATALCMFSCRQIPGDDTEPSVIGVWQCTYADYGSLPEDQQFLIKGDKLTLEDNGTYCLEAIALKGSGTWSLEGDKLIINFRDGRYTFTITELTQDRLFGYLFYKGNVVKFNFFRD